MKKTIAGILLFVWVILGVGITWYFYRNFTTATDANMKNRIVQIQTYSKNQNEMLDKLPRVFSEAPATAVILILNQKSKLLGSLYEPARISMEDYQAILKSYKTMELKNFAYLHLPFSGGYSVWVISKKNISLPQAVGFMLENNSRLILIPIVFIFSLLIILMMLFFDSSVNRQSPDQHKERPVLSEGSSGVSGEIKSPSIIAGNQYLSNKIILLLDTIEKNFSTSMIAFYSRESGKWRHVLEKTGNLTVRGDAAVENLPVEILNLSDNTWREPLLSQDKRLLFIPLHYRNLLFGLIKIQFTGLASELDNQLLNRLISLCTRYSDSLFMQRVYDKAVTDPETDFYNYPYFYFIVKEKLATAQKFAVVVFEISDLNRISPESTRLWAQDLILELNAAQLKPVVSARLDRAKFAFLYEIELDSARQTRQESKPSVKNGKNEKPDLARLETVPGIVQNVTDRYFKHAANVTGGFFLRPTDFEDADAFMQRLDYLLINSTFSAYPSDFTGKFSVDLHKKAV